MSARCNDVKMAGAGYNSEFDYVDEEQDLPAGHYIVCPIAYQEFNEREDTTKMYTVRPEIIFPL